MSTSNLCRYWLVSRLNRVISCTHQVGGDSDDGEEVSVVGNHAVWLGVKRYRCLKEFVASTYLLGSVDPEGEDWKVL